MGDVHAEYQKKIRAILADFMLGVIAVSVLGISSARALTTNDIQEQWSNQYGTAVDERINANCVTSDGSIVSAGLTFGSVTNGTNLGNSDGWIIKTDSSGNGVWSKQYGSSADEYLTSIVETGDGGFIAAGYTFGSVTNGTHIGNFDGWILRVDGDGNELWSRQYGTGQYDQFYSAKQDISTPGAYILAGYTVGTLSGQVTHGGQDGWVLKVDSSGNVIWSRQYGTTVGDTLSGVLPEADGYVVSGHTAGTVTNGVRVGGTDGWFLKLDTLGNEVWSKQYGTTLGDFLWSSTKASDGGYVAAGFTPGTLPGNVNVGGQDGLIIKVDANGDLVWEKQFGSSAIDSIWSIQQNGDEFVAAGQTQGQVTDGTALGDIDGWILQVDADGAELLSKQYGTPAADYFRTVAVPTSHTFIPGGYTAGSVTNGTNLGATDGWLLNLETLFTITFDLNQGDGVAPATQSLIAGEFGLAVGDPVRAGYTFAGWNTSQDGAGTAWDLETDAMPTNNITLYAQWQENNVPGVEYTLKFDLNGGSGTAPGNQMLQEGALAAKPANPVRDGYTFTGWNTSKDGSGTVWDFATTTMPAGDAVLYAQWKESDNPISIYEPAGKTSPGTGDRAGLTVLAVLVVASAGVFALVKAAKVHKL